MQVSQSQGNQSMAFFSKSDPVATAQAAVDVGIKEHAALDSLRADACASLSAETDGANRLASGGADAETLGKQEARVSVADKLHSRRVLAVESKDADIARLKSVHDKALEDREIGETCIYNHKLKEELIAENAVFVASAARIYSIFERAELIAPEAGGYKQFAGTLAAEGPEAAALICKLIDNNTAAVSARQAPAKGKRLAAPVILPAVARPVRVSLFCTRSIKFVDPDSGKLIVAQKFSDVEMPPTFAKVALDHKVCVRITDPLRAQHNNSVAGHPDPAHAFDLDAAMSEPKPAAVDPIRASSPPASPFTIVDRGGPVQMKVAR
jgi:hypothetical protein